MVNKLLLEAQPPIARSTLRGTVVCRPLFMEPHVASWCSQGALPLGGLRFVQDGHSGDALVSHVPLQSLAIDIALGVATSAYKKEVEMFADMTEGSVGILVDYPTIGTKGRLPPSTLNCQGLSHQTSMSVEVCQ